MRISTRLHLAVLPAILGLALVAALAYWGERGRQAPEAILVVALVAASGSLAVSWWNLRDVAARIGRLSRLPRPAGAERARHAGGGWTSGVGAVHGGDDSPDELDEIESSVAGLSRVVERERAEAGSRIAVADARAGEYGMLLAQTVRELGARVEEVQLPLHILLASPFGALNENQEELLGAARDAASAADAELRLLDRLVTFDQRGATAAVEPVSVVTLLQSPLAIARERAAPAVRVRMEASELLPRVVVHVPAVQEALTTLLSSAVSSVQPGGEVILSARSDGGDCVTLRVTPPAERAEGESLQLRLARRVMAREGGGAWGGVDPDEFRLPAEHWVTTMEVRGGA